MKPLLISIPHSGEEVGEEAYWLKNLPEVTLMYDVDRFVNRLYQPALDQLNIVSAITPFHRYVADCNRWPEDIDCDSVEGSKNPSGSHPTGLHWRLTTNGDILIKKPITPHLHERILNKYYNPFFTKIDSLYKDFQQKGAKQIYHLDLHSMPSRGTSAHRDPNEDRADVIVCTKGECDQKGDTASSQWIEKIVTAYRNQGLRVRMNYPYFGGIIIKKYGQPEKGTHAVMVELNRKLYMNEKTKQWIPEKARVLQNKLKNSLSEIYEQIPDTEIK